MSSSNFFSPLAELSEDNDVSDSELTPQSVAKLDTEMNYAESLDSSSAMEEVDNVILIFANPHTLAQPHDHPTFSEESESEDLYPDAPGYPDDFESLWSSDDETYWFHTMHDDRDDSDCYSYDEYEEEDDEPYDEYSSYPTIRKEWATYSERYLPISISTASEQDNPPEHPEYDPEYVFDEDLFPSLTNSTSDESDMSTNQCVEVDVLTSPPIVERLRSYLSWYDRFDIYTLAQSCRSFLNLYGNYQPHIPSFNFKILPSVQRNRHGGVYIRLDTAKKIENFISIGISAA